MLDSFDHLLADNTRSILIGAEVLRATPHKVKSVAVVRDNRFHCARPSQSRIYNSRICKTCDFGCAKEDAKDHQELRKKTLAATAEARTSSLNTYEKVMATSHELARHVGKILDEETTLVRVPNTFGNAQKIHHMTFGVAQLPRDELTIIGMLNENKGQLQFIKKCTNWLKSKPDVKIVLCGRGPRIEKAIKNHLKKHDLEKRVRLLGFRSREEIFQQIRKSKLILAPTVWPEPFGRVPLEAGVSGRAVVAFAVGGLVESIIHGKTGFLVESGDYKEFCERVDELLEDHELRLSMEAEARVHIARTYGPDKTTKLFSQVAFGSDVADESSLKVGQ